jgi:hypothetical protein
MAYNPPNSCRAIVGAVPDILSLYLRSGYTPFGAFLCLLTNLCVMARGDPPVISGTAMPILEHDFTIE